MAGTDKRLSWVDNARGLGIALVVIGHVSSVPAVHRWIFLFHMPLFFALSGALAKPVASRDYAIGRGRALLVPYAVYLVLIGLADLLLSDADGDATAFAGMSALSAARRLAMGGTELGGVFGVFWFVPCLYLAGLAFNALTRRLGTGPALAGVALLAALVSYVLRVRHDPYGLLDVPMAVFFFWVGRTLMRPDRAERLGGIGLPVAAAIFLAAGMIAAPFDMKALVFGHLPVNLVAAVAGSAAVVGIGFWTARIPGLGAVLALLGRASLVVMFLHQLIHFHLEGRMPEWGIMIVALIVPTILWAIFDRSLWTRRLLLGSGWGPAPAKAVHPRPRVAA